MSSNRYLVILAAVVSFLELSCSSPQLASDSCSVERYPDSVGASKRLSRLTCPANLSDAPIDQPSLAKFQKAIRTTTAGTGAPEGFEDIAGFGQRPLTEETAVTLIDRLLNSEDPVHKAVDALVVKLGGPSPQNPIFWDYYFGSYDRFVGFAAGYTEIFERAAHWLRDAKTAADLGAGTCNGTAILLEQNQAIHITAIDGSKDGLAQGKKKAEIIAGAHSHRAEFVQGNLITDPLPENLDGAVMNNVLYTLGDNKLAVLKKIHEALKPGGIFVLSDPSSYTQKKENLKIWLTQIVMSAIRNGSPATEADLAFIGSMVMRVLMGPIYLTREETLVLLQAAGFDMERDVLENSTSYYGGANFIVVRKGAAPK